MEYRELYYRYQKLHWTGHLIQAFTIRRLQKMFEPRMHRDLDSLHKETFPRRRKMQWKNLPADKVEAIQSAWAEKAMVYLAAAMAKRVSLKNQLDERSHTESLKPLRTDLHLDEMTLVSLYRSQGMGASKYARTPLENKARLLQTFGFTAGVKTLDAEHREIEKGTWGPPFRYELWTNADPWQIDICTRRQDITEWATACWATGTNPKVFHPFLPDDIYEISMAAHMSWPPDLEKAAKVLSGQADTEEGEA